MRINRNVNPVWHDMWKQEKCSPLEPPRGNFYKTQWAGQGVNCVIYTIDVNFNHKSLEIFEIKSADKIWSKKDKVIKVSYLMPIRVKGGFNSERADAFVSSPNRRTELFSWARFFILFSFHSKWLKLCQIRTWSFFNAFFEHWEQLIWNYVSHLEWKKFKILAQENN